jgi:hypothetical protein
LASIPSLSGATDDVVDDEEEEDRGGADRDP